MERDNLARGIALKVARVTVLILAVFCARATLGHHSIPVTFDVERYVEIDGEITRILWRNPHIRLTVRALGEDGEEADWTIEGGAVSRLARWGVPEGVLGVGDTITLAGFPSRRRSNEMYGQNLLLPDGREVVLDHRSPPRWRDDALGGQRMSEGTANSSLGIFRVWTSDGQSYDAETASYPLTEAAQAALAAWEPLVNNPYYGCMPKGMPTIMQQPFPIEFVDQGDELLLRIEEYDLVREISMNGEAPAPSIPRSILGDSVGRWDGETLVVKTTNLGWPYSFDQVGIPQSEAVELTERFTVADDGSRLEYEITSIDPENFTEPLILRKSYFWVPGLEVRPYECTIG